jgi:hypothetical protein
MAETRLQSDMIQNMGRSAAAAMFQRNQILANQQEWLDYVQARDGGAFQPSYGGGYLHEEYLPGERQQANTYLKYYQQQQAKQLAFQRQRFLNAQRFQNDYMLQQQKFMNEQAAEEQKVARNKQEMDRRLAVVSSELDALENNPEIDKNSWEYKARRQQLLDDRYQLETDLERNTPQVHEEDSGFTKTVIDPETGEKREEPIMSRFILGPDGKPIYHVQGKDVAANQLEREKLEQKEKEAARTANLRSREIDVTEKNAENAAFDKRRETADKLEERKKDAAKKRREKIDSYYKSQQGKQDVFSSNPEEKRKAILEYERLEQERLDKLDELDHEEGLEEWKGVPYKVELPTYRPTGREVQDEIRRQNILNKDNPTEDELNEQVQYDSPMDPEFSDEQFAGTEPAGLYDPTGQPLPMDGGMYNGLA